MFSSNNFKYVVIALMLVFILASAGVVVKIGDWINIAPASPEHDGKPCQVALTAKLRPLAVETTLNIAFAHKRGLSWEQSTTTTVQLNRQQPKKTVMVELPGAGQFQYTLDAHSQLHAKGQPVRAHGSFTGTVLLKEGTKLVYGIDTSQGQLRRARTSWLLPFRPYLQAVTGDTHATGQFPEAKFAMLPAVQPKPSNPTSNPNPRKPTSTITFLLRAQLGTLQQNESIKIKIGEQNINWYLTRTDPAAQQVVTLPGAGSYEYVIEAKSGVPAGNRTVNLVGSGQGDLQLKGGEVYHYMRSAPSGGFYLARLQRVQ